ncbi:MAG: LysO family transporter [Chloroflexi bacterium]|nr:LysO family transporter [Chloroflexota bacterium]
MWNILIFFAVGVFLGWLIRKHPKWIKSASWGSSILLGLLIFLLGVSTGSRPDVLGNFSKLGFTAVALALGGIAGSMMFVIPATRKWTGRQK